MHEQRAQASAHASEALSVSAAVAYAKEALESVTVRLVGEVSELSNKPGYKAVYFTVKDKSAALPCMMWNNRYHASQVELRVGALVELTGRFTLYAAKGRMNFDVFSIALAGEGNLRLQVANLARKLQAEGLMAPERKRALPALPQVIGLVTSPRGAAVHDVLRTLRRRYPLARVEFAGVAVEGANAPSALIEGMRCVVRAGAEVVLLVRGGGSFEDLMPFNDEALARAIAEMPVAVVTGIGHEPDTSIADMVADVRASTPTAAAEAVAPAQESLHAHLRALGEGLAAREHRQVLARRMRVDAMRSLPLFREPERLLGAYAQRLDEAADRLSSALPRALERDRHALKSMRSLMTHALAGMLRQPEQRVLSLGQRLRYAGESGLSRYGAEVSVAAARLHDLSPLAVIARGYAVARDEQGRIVKSVGAVGRGSKLALSVADGVVDCEVLDARRIDTAVETL